MVSPGKDKTAGQKFTTHLTLIATEQMKIEVFEVTDLHGEKDVGLNTREL